MSEAIDTRIVEAKFDSAQFEQGVDRTVKKLDELKKSLELEKSGESIAKLADKTKEATDKASNSLKQLEDRFTSFTGMIKQKLLSGIVDEIVGGFFRIKNSVEGLVKSLSTGQISVGMSKYEQMLTSVRTIVAAGDDENAAYEAIDTLGAYADQTSYSLDQMTSALSKMRAAGVDLKTGTKAVEGISNACAAAGVNATDASRAFYNLSQAYSSGYLKYTDYRSLELLNMTTEKFKLQMLEAAEAAGTLKKVSDGVYQTINKNDKKVTAGRKVTIKTLSDSLRYNFMNNEAMNKLFGEKFFFDEEQWQRLQQVYGKDGALAKAKEEYGDIAVEAYFAAREARSFTDVMNTLKDVISRGWSKSFEIVFGRLSEASEFFTNLAESNLAEGIFAISSFRNAVLQSWSDSGGRDSMLRALENIDNLLGRIFQKLGLINVDGDPEKFQKNFDDTTRSLAHDLTAITLSFEEFTKKLNEWFTDERISRIQKVFSIIGSVLSTMFRVLGIAFNFATKAFETFEPILAKIIDNVGKVIERVQSIFDNGKKEKGVQDGLDTLQGGLDNILKALEPLVAPLSKIIDFLGDVAVFFVDLAAGTFVSNLEFLSDTLGFIIELFGGTSSQQEMNDGKGVIDGLKTSIMDLGNACSTAFNFVKDFFHNLYQDLLLVLGIREPQEGEEGGFFSNIANFFKTNTFISDIKKWIKELPGKISKLGTELWNIVDEFLFGKKVGKITIKDKNTGQKNTYTLRLKTGFSKFLDEAIKSIKEWLGNDLPKKIKEIWNTIDDFLFGKKQSYEQMSNAYGANITGGSHTRIKEGFSAWLDQAIADVGEWIKNLPDKISELWNTVIGAIFYRDPKPKEINPDTGKEYGPNDRVKTGFLVWLENIPTKLWTWLSTDLPKILKNIWETVMGWIFGPTMAEVAEYDPEIRKDKYYEPNKRVGTAFSKWLGSIPGSIKTWIDDELPGILKNIWETVMGWIFGPTMAEVAEYDPEIRKDKDYEPNKRVGTSFSKWLESIPGNIKTWLSEELPGKLLSIWKTVINFIFGEEVDPEAVNPETGEAYGPNVRVKEGFSKWLDEVIKSVSEWIKTVPDKIKNIWDTVLKAIFGTKQDNTEEIKGPKKILVSQEFYDETKLNYGSSAVQDYEVMQESARKSIIETAKEFVDTLGIDIGKIIADLPTSILNNLTFGFDLFDILLKNVTEWFNGENNKDGTLTEKVADEVKDAEGNTSPLLTALVEFGKRIKELFIVTIPGFIREAFIWIGSKASGIWDGLYSAFTGEEATTEIGVAISGFGLKIRKAIENLPRYIQEGLEWLKKNLFKKQEQPINIDDLLVNNKPWVKKDIFNKNDRNKFNKEMVDEVEQLQYDFKDTSKLLTIGMEDEDPFNFGEWISALGTSLVNVFAELGPYILEGLNKVLEWIGKGLTWLTSAFNSKKEGEGIGEAVNRTLKDDAEASKFSGLVGALTKIGETIKNLITTIIPDFVTAGVKVLSEEIPKIMGNIGNIFGEPETAKEIDKNIKKNSKTGLESTGKEEMTLVKASAFNFATNPNVIPLDGVKDANKQSKSIKDIALDTVDNFGGILEGFKDLAKSDTGKTVALLVAISLVLSKMKDMMHFGEDLKDAAKAAKWEAIKVAVYFIVGLLSYLTVLASTGNTEQMNAVFDMFKKFEGFVDKLKDFMVTFMSFKTAITGLKSAGEFFGRKTGNFGSAAGKTLVLTTSAAFAGDVITESIQDWVNSLGVVFASLKTGFESLKEAMGDLGEINTQLDSLDGVIDRISNFLYEIRNIFKHDEKVIINGKEETIPTDFQEGMDSVLDLFVRINGTIAEFKNAVSGENIHAEEITSALFDLTGMQSAMTDFSVFAGTKMFEDFKYAIASLGSALSMFSGGAYSKINIDSEFISKAVDAVIAIIKNDKIRTFADELTKTGDELPDNREIYKQSEKLVMLAGAVASIGDASKHISRNTGTYIQTLFDTISSLDFESIGDGKDDKITKFAQNFGVIGNAIGTFANETKEFSKENIDNAKEAVEMTVDLIYALRGTMQSGIEKAWNGDESIEQFGFNFATFADKLKSGLDKLAAPGISYDEKGLDQALHAIRSIVVSYAQLSVANNDLLRCDFSNVAKGLSGDTGLATALKEFMQTLSGKDAPKITDEDFKNLNHIFDLINLLGTFASHSHGVSFETEMNDLVSGLKKYNPFVEIAKCMGDVRDIAGTVAYDEKMSTLIDSFGNMLIGLASLAKYTKGSYQNEANRWYITDLMTNIGDVFSGLHESFGDIELFFHEVDTFDINEIDKAATLFESLRNLGEALTFFSNNKIFTGVENLKFFDWSTFMQKLKDAMALEFNENEDVFAPRIVPVLEISDDFVEKANQIRSMLGMENITVNAQDMYDIPEASLSIADKIKIPDPINYEERLKDIYDKLESVNFNVSHLGYEMGNMKFIIYGDRLTETIGPSMDRYLGSEGVYVARVNGKD